MDIIFPDTGLLYSLQSVIGPGLWYNLFANDHTPTLDDTLASFSLPTWSGYHAVYVPIAQWTLQIVQAHVGGIQAPPIAFPNTSPADQKVFGYFVVDDSLSILLAAARFDLAPITILAGSYKSVTPILGTYSGLQS